MKTFVERFPHCKSALIFHESGGGPYPEELIGGVTEITPEIAAADSNKVATALATMKLWCEVDPSIRLIVGNSGSSIGLIARLLRGGCPPEYIDAFGEESTGQTWPPEISTALTPWTILRLAKIYGYTNAVMDCPFEWKVRTTRNLPPMSCINIRDILIAHALRYTMIPAGSQCEVANSYSDTIWGNGGFTRWPLAYPRPIVLAISTLTTFLDRAEFVRVVPTGSLTTYALEFKKTDSSFVCALWTPRFPVPVKVGADEFTVSDVYGAAVTHDGGMVVASEKTCYVFTKTPVSGFEAVITDVMPKSENKRGTIVQPLVSPDEFEISSARDFRIEGATNCTYKTFLRAGKFEAAAGKTAADGTGGDCVALTHVSSKGCPELIQEYTFLKFKDAKPVDGAPDTIGLWVRGNSSWGHFFFEITDAEGEVWLSNGTGGYGSYVYDRPCQAAMNFDGWHFIEFPIIGKSPVKVFSPGENQWQWQRDGEFGNGQVDYPIRVTGLGVGNFTHALNILEMEPTDPVIKIKDLMVY